MWATASGRARAGAGPGSVAADVRRDTKKLESYEDFAASVEGPNRSLKQFAEQRRAYLLSHTEPAGAKAP